MKTIIKTTIAIVKNIKMEGYIIAHFIFALSSRRSSRFLSKSFKIFHNKPVFSPTQTRLIVRGSKTSGNLFID
jgi:hypothetical protein